MLEVQNFASDKLNATVNEAEEWQGDEYGSYVTYWTVDYQIKQWVPESYPSTNYGLYIDVRGAQNNIALGIAAGSIAGMRLKPTIVTESLSLTVMQNFIVCYNKNPITIQLPANPEPGQLIYFYPVNDYQVTISSNKKLLTSKEEDRYSLNLLLRKIHMYFFDGTN